MTVPAVPVARDWSLHSGERQTVTRIDEVRADHRARYVWAGDAIGVMPHAHVLDVFCGTGYGTAYLAEATKARVTGIDGSAESIALAAKHNDNDEVRFQWHRWPSPHASFGVAKYDAIVCFESLEHVTDDRGFARALSHALKPDGLLCVSVPNERVLPHASFRNAFHVRHYTLSDVIALLPSLSLRAWYGQPGREGTDAELVPAKDGRSLVCLFQRRGD